MGGNALSVPSIRLDKSEYKDLSRRIRNGFRESLQIIPSYRNKPSFGDMDVLYKNDYSEFYDLSNIAFVEDILKKFCGLTVKERFKNGNIVSYGVQLPQGMFQFDFIGIQSKYFDFALNYFSYNDMGNLLGRVAHSMGLKLSFGGLKYVQRDPQDRVLKEHTLTLDWNDALDSLGYSPAPYDYGFDDLEDIFEFVVNNPYYSRSYYELSARNYEARIRDRKRTTYRAFLEWTEKNVRLGCLGTANEPDKTAHLKRMFEKYPAFYMDHSVELEKNRLEEESKLYYNGNIIMELTGLKGKALGSFMKDLKPKMHPAVVLEYKNSVKEVILSEFKKKYPMIKEFSHVD